MSHLLAIAGWLVAAAGLTAAVALRRRLDARLEAVARACHELRGPLTAARLGIESLPGVPPASLRRLRAVDAQLVRAGVMLEALANPGARRPGPLERIEPRALLEGSVEAWRPAAQARGMSLSLRWDAGAGVRVWGDPVGLALAVENLIRNALEHGGGAVEVQARRRGSRLVVAVCDEGPGLACDWRRLAARADRGRGTRGRGLAIAAAVARAHGGALRCAPAARGARVVLDLPLSGAPRRARGA
ncbi:MAG TPA: HAMP domain-containing sensor histidine kinase [Solirubrobacteraceae bacterium]|nr:HAMP domain-containing sensor histidine kinase [Solirubrobacteraceae bacterium]